MCSTAAGEEQEGCGKRCGVLHEGTWRDGGGGDGEDLHNGGPSVEEDQQSVHGAGPHGRSAGSTVQ